MRSSGSYRKPCKVWPGPCWISGLGTLKTEHTWHLPGGSVAGAFSGAFTDAVPWATVKFWDGGGGAGPMSRAEHKEERQMEFKYIEG